MILPPKHIWFVMAVKLTHVDYPPVQLLLNKYQRLLDIIADSQNLQVLTGDISNAFTQAHTRKNIYTKCSLEFGDREHSIVVIVRALHGVTASAECFRTMIANFLRNLGFLPSHYDRDVWMILRDDKTEYG